MLKDSVKRLFNRLEAIGKVHKELYDTDVREQLAETLDFAFISGRKLPSVPLSYGMFSADADAAVADAVLVFLKESLPAAAAESVAKGAARHAVLHDASILTKGRRRYDNFIGHSDAPLNCKEISAHRLSRTGEPE